ATGCPLSRKQARGSWRRHEPRQHDPQPDRPGRPGRRRLAAARAAPAGSGGHPRRHPGQRDRSAVRHRTGVGPGCAAECRAAIAIVLYLGAFLIVTSVAIFLAYSWGDIEGDAKLGLLILITIAFLGVAALCLRYPSVRLAGRTFLAIGALLVPANVAAAYILV